MKSKTVLVTSLAAATLGLVSLVDTAGVLPFSVQTVQADSIIAVGNVDHKVDLSLVGYDNNNGVSIKFSTDSINPNFVDNDNSNQDFIIVRTRLVNAKTKEVLQEETGASADKGTAETSSSTSKTASGKMDINAIKNGDFSSIEGRWSNGHGGEDLVFSKDGLIAPEKFKVDLTESEFVNGFLRARYSGPSFGVFIQFIPAGVRIPDETSMDGLISDASDISKDRIIYRASFPVHNKPEQFLYRVE